jgi:Hemerythrin HHE cation binding domain
MRVITKGMLNSFRALPGNAGEDALAAMAELESQHRTAEQLHTELDGFVGRLPRDGSADLEEFDTLSELVAELTMLYRGDRNMSLTEEPQRVEDVLTEDHRELDQLIGASLEALDQGDAVEAFLRIDRFWARLAMHIRAENHQLFPSILLNAGGDSPSSEARAAIEKLRSDHDFFMQQLSGALKILRASQTAGSESSLKAVTEIVRTVRDRLEVHNELEEVMVYLLPGRVLAPPEQGALIDRIRQELLSLPPRFAEDADEGT